jgi:hypothetical protein
MIRQASDADSAHKLTELSEKLSRIKDLRSKIERNDSELKLQYILLMRERNVYFEKLKMIQNLGDGVNWQDDSGLLPNLKQLLSNLGQYSDKSNV